MLKKNRQYWLTLVWWLIESALLLSKFQMLFLELIIPWKCGFWRIPWRKLQLEMLHTRLKALRLKFQQHFHFSISDLCARTSQWQFSGGKNCVSVEDDSTNEWHNNPSTHLKVSYKKEMDRSHLFENTDLCCRLFWPLHEHVSVQKTEDLQDLIKKEMAGILIILIGPFGLVTFCSFDVVVAKNV